MSVKKAFWKNVVPAMLSFAFSGVYAIVDGIFIGQNIGDIGLAAVNIAYPIAAFIQAVGTGLGMACAIWLAVCIGKNDSQGEKEYLGSAYILLVVASVALTAILTVIHTPVLKMLGAQGELLGYAQDYIKIISLGSAFQIMGVGLLPIIRNYNGAMVAMYAMALGFGTNVVLDWLFIQRLGLGIAGAAAATVIGQGVTMVPCVAFLLAKGRVFSYAKFKLTKGTVKGLLAAAMSPLGLTLSPNIVIIILNRGAIAYGNETAVACYAVISYVVCVAQLLLQGIADGSQPLVGRYFGGKDNVALKKVEELTYSFGAVTALVCGAVMYLSRKAIPILFGASQETAQMYAQVLPYFIFGLVLMAFLRVTTSLFYATQRNKYAYALIYGEPLLLLIMVGFVLPRRMGLEGVWLSVPVVQVCLAVFGMFLLCHSKRKSEH
ncbi:MAG: MATE family efflux transporter [Oscillospiraceae bacterium]